MKKLIVCMLVCMTAAHAFAEESFGWAEEAAKYCIENEILHGDENGNLNLGESITNEQTAKILVSAFGRENDVSETGAENTDVSPERWSYPYITAFNGFSKKKIESKNVSEASSREEFVSALVSASGLKESNIRNKNILSYNFRDSAEVDKNYEKLLCIAVERGYMKGSDGYLNPKESITRAEACSLIYRVMRATKSNEVLDLGVIASSTPIKGEPTVSKERAIEWAKKRNASDMFIEAAEYYWQYGELTGIRPEILYAQSAKETGYGKFGGNVLPEQNNFAGIKVYGATGDTSADHETFASVEDGVRGHFNHMTAYVGGEPVGEVHQRYYSTSKMPWAGTVTTLEELGGKWCPDLYYGYSILHDYIEPMMNTK